MAAIRKRGNSYLIVVSMGYDYLGRRIKPVQKTVKPPENLTEKQVERMSRLFFLKWRLRIKNNLWTKT